MADHKPVEPQPTTRLTAEERAEAKRLADAATPGPWHYEEERYSAKCVIGLKPQDDRWLAHCQPALNGEGNGRFIASSRTLVPRLLADLEAVERERDEVRLKLGNSNAAWLGVRMNYEVAKKERDTARARLAERDKELALRDSADPPCSKSACESYRADLDTARARLAEVERERDTLAEALRLIAEPCRSRCERRPPGAHKCLPCIARDALKAAGVEEKT